MLHMIAQEVAKRVMDEQEPRNHVTGKATSNAQRRQKRLEATGPYAGKKKAATKRVVGGVVQRMETLAEAFEDLPWLKDNELPLWLNDVSDGDVDTVRRALLLALDATGMTTRKGGKGGDDFAIGIVPSRGSAVYGERYWSAAVAFLGRQPEMSNASIASWKKVCDFVSKVCDPDTGRLRSLVNNTDKEPRMWNGESQLRMELFQHVMSRLWGEIAAAANYLRSQHPGEDRSAWWSTIVRCANDDFVFTGGSNINPLDKKGFFDLKRLFGSGAKANKVHTHEGLLKYILNNRRTDNLEADKWTTDDEADADDADATSEQEDDEDDEDDME